MCVMRVWKKLNKKYIKTKVILSFKDSLFRLFFFDKKNPKSLGEDLGTNIKLFKKYKHALTAKSLQ